MTKEQRLKKRHNAEKRFRFYGLASIFFALLFVLILVHNIFSKGSSAFMKTAINVEVFYDKDLLELEPGASEEEILEADFFVLTFLLSSSSSFSDLLSEFSFSSSESGAGVSDANK